MKFSIYNGNNDHEFKSNSPRLYPQEYAQGFRYDGV